MLFCGLVARTEGSSEDFSTTHSFLKRSGALVLMLRTGHTDPAGRVQERDNALSPGYFTSQVHAARKAMGRP